MTLVQAWVGLSADGKVVMPEPEPQELTLMVRNLPNKYSPPALLEELKQWRQYIDFFYCPIDFKNGGNLGYCFFNFHNVAAAKAFREQYDKTRLPQFLESGKVLAVSDARVQGKSANVERFRNSSVMGVLEQSYRPMVFDKSGNVMEFPKPDGEIPATGPRFRRPR
jgi:RNA recognition motif-containing protein